MGLFDTLIVEEDLPVTDDMKRLNIDTRLNLQRASNPKERNFDEMCEHFQTKDFDRCLATYYLKNKKLYVEKYKTQEGKYEPNLEEVPLHGTINFYTGINDIMDMWDIWVEYKATFTHGNLDKIELVEFREKDNAERRNKEIKLKLQRDYERNLWYNKYIFNRKLWRKFEFKIWHNGWCKLSDFCQYMSKILP